MSEFLTLKEYDKRSTILLLKANLPCSAEYLSFINEMMMKADMKYNDDMTSFTRDQFRYFYGKYGIKTLIKKFKNEQKKKDMFVSLVKHDQPLVPLYEYDIGVEDYNVLELEEIIAKIEKSSVLTEQEKTVIKYLTLDKMSPKEIAEALSISTQRYYFILNSIQGKIQWLKNLLEK